MFGFWRNAKQDAQEFRNKVTDDLSDLLVHVTYGVAIARGYKENEPQAKALLERQGRMVLRFEAIRAGYHPKEISEPRSKAAAEVANSAVNTAILTSKLDMKKMAEGLRYILERDYSKHEVEAAKSISQLVSGPVRFGL